MSQDLKTLLGEVIEKQKAELWRWARSLSLG